MRKQRNFVNDQTTFRFPTYGGLGDLPPGRSGSPGVLRAGCVKKINETASLGKGV